MDDDAVLRVACDLVTPEVATAVPSVFERSSRAAKRSQVSSRTDRNVEAGATSEAAGGPEGRAAIETQRAGSLSSISLPVAAGDRRGPVSGSPFLIPMQEKAALPHSDADKHDDMLAVPKLVAAVPTPLPKPPMSGGQHQETVVTPRKAVTLEGIVGLKELKQAVAGTPDSTTSSPRKRATGMTPRARAPEMEQSELPEVVIKGLLERRGPRLSFMSLETCAELRGRTLRVHGEYRDGRRSLLADVILSEAFRIERTQPKRWRVHGPSGTKQEQDLNFEWCAKSAEEADRWVACIQGACLPDNEGL